MVKVGSELEQNVRLFGSEVFVSSFVRGEISCVFALCFFFCLFDNFVFTYARLSCRCLREFIVCCSYYTLFCCCYLHTLNSKKSLTLLLCFKLYFCSLSALATLSTLASPPLLLWLPMMHLRKGLVASCQRRGRKGCCCRCLQSSFLPSFLRLVRSAQATLSCIPLISLITVQYKEKGKEIRIFFFWSSSPAQR